MCLRNRIFVRTVQILFGLYLIFFGVIGYLIKMPMPEYNEAATAFLTGLFASGYLFHLMSLVFVLSGLMFIFNKWSAFGALLLAPISVNILFFHVFVDSQNFIMALIPFVLNLYLIFVHWVRYKTIFQK